ncbi:hypothetical protein EBB07_02875 [Paenibacillaceae bacterium]|nr:hypothetical protein EBB07_02875 [Paenibacillaceae bacterium]
MCGAAATGSKQDNVGRREPLSSEAGHGVRRRDAFAPEPDMACGGGMHSLRGRAWRPAAGCIRYEASQGTRRRDAFAPGPDKARGGGTHRSLARQCG